MVMKIHMKDIVEHSKAVIVRGISGSGKSTFSNAMAKWIQSQGYSSCHFEADQFFYNEDGDYLFDPSLLQAAHEVCFKNFQESFNDGGHVVIVSNTFTKFWEMDRYLKHADGEIIVFRMTNEFENIHNVPDEVLRNQKARFQNFRGEILVGPEYEFVW